ncbi:dihydrodipicolinate synthase/N-acetylneuraminate lyase [Rhizobium mongolense]
MSGLSKFPITPMKRDGQIAADALRALIARLCAAEVDSIGLLGSTGTYTDLARKERRRALALALEETGGRILPLSELAQAQDCYCLSPIRQDVSPLE